MDELIILVGENGRREAFAELRSIGQSEFYQAQATGYKPELKFVLADHLDYGGETLIEYTGTLYSVLRTFRAGQALEIVVSLASAEEVEVYG